jgi:uncharacterized protein
MKFLLLLGIFFLVAWAWRSSRSTQKSSPPVKPASKDGKAIEMTACAHCGVHLALADAVTGRKGSYCSPEHRAATES